MTRSAVVSLQADSCQLETNPERTREELRRCPNMTGSGVHGKGTVPNVRFSNNMRTVSKQAGRYQRNERASRLLELLLAPQEKALLEDLDPCCWRMSCKPVVEDSELSTLCATVRSRAGVWQRVLRLPLADRPAGERAAVDLEPAQDSLLERCRLWPPGRGRRRCGCCCLTSGAEEKRVHCGAGDQLQRRGLARGVRISAYYTSAMLSRHGRGREVHRQEVGVAPVVKGSTNYTGEEPFRSC